MILQLIRTPRIAPDRPEVIAEGPHDGNLVDKAHAKLEASPHYTPSPEPEAAFIWWSIDRAVDAKQEKSWVIGHDLDYSYTLKVTKETP